MSITGNNIKRAATALLHTTIGNVIGTILGIAVLLFAVYLLLRGSHVSVGQSGKTVLSPTQIQSIKAIGQWEFLSISDEEIVDTTRHGFFSDDELVRIYDGTLRLGIDLGEVKEGWIACTEDSVAVSLPPIRLLDEHFIDEARSRSFFETGKWEAADRERLYQRAATAMRRRCLTRKNIETAQHNAESQFVNLFRSMGVAKVGITFAEPDFTVSE